MKKVFNFCGAFINLGCEGLVSFIDTLHFAWRRFNYPWSDAEEIEYFLRDPKDRHAFEEKLNEMYRNGIREDTLFVNGRNITIKI